MPTLKFFLLSLATCLLLLPVTLFGGRETTHTKINADIGLPDDPATKAVFEFLDKALKK